MPTTPALKPFNGTITGWRRVECQRERGLGWFVEGWNADHPTKPAADVTTSEVVSFDEATGEIETMNSRYRLGGPAVEN
ncbi:hypothetical protein [Reyranella sp.]|uniref:hypothetical protein n=1 Tax=Reyranella sp. TaxID=1929291 RepID=UPI00403579EF